MEVEDKIQLTDIAEVVVQYLNKQVHTLEVCKLIVGDINTHGEEKPSISPIYHFVGLELQAVKLLESKVACCSSG